MDGMISTEIFVHHVHGCTMIISCTRYGHVKRKWEIERSLEKGIGGVCSEVGVLFYPPLENYFLMFIYYSENRNKK